MIEGSSLWSAASGSAAAAANPIACPYLGLADDPRTHFAFAVTAHECHSGSRPKPIELTHQATFCLSANYPACRRYVVPTAAAAGLAVLPGRAEAPVAPVSGRVQLRSGPHGRRRLVVRAAVLLVAVLILASVAAGVFRQGGSPPAGPSGVAGSSPTASLASPTASPQPSPTDSLPPTSAPPTSSPTTSPTRSASALPTTHVVARGETLSSIAGLYGVTVAAIQKANGITDPSHITVGQRLIIPAP